MRALAGAALLLGALAITPAHAEVVIYRCTDGSGAVTLQNGTPCPKGSRQQKKVMDTPTTSAPAHAPPPAPPEPAPAAPVAVPEPVAAPEPEPISPPRQPPPALFACQTWSRERYFGETAQPPPRCAPLQVTGLDGTGAMAGGTACQMMEDRCEPVPAFALCDAWKQRVRDLDARTTFGGGEPVAPAEAERIRRTFAESTCAP